MTALESPQARLLVGAATAICLALAVAAARTADVAQRSPIEPPGAWRAVLIAGIAGSALLYLLGVALHRTPGLSARPALVVATLIQLIPLAAPLLLSLDVYAYWDYGRLVAEHGLNPYADAPNVAPNDPAFNLMGRDWRDHNAIYGPVFIGLAALHASVVGSDPDIAAFGWRLVAAGSGIALAVLAARLAERPALAAVFVGWSPLVALHLAGGGHNDGLMMALVLSAVLLARRGRQQVGGFLWAPAIAIKPVPLVLLPLAALGGRPRFGWYGLVGGVVLVAACASAAFGSAWLASAAPIAQVDRVSSVSIPFWISKLDLSWRYPAALLSLLFGVAYLALLVQAWRGRPRLGLAAGCLVLSLAWLMPWYAIWPLSLAAWEEDRLARVLALGLSFYLLRDAVPL